MAISAPAFAADMAVKAPPRAVVQQAGGFYVWVDGSAQWVNLPSIALGIPVAIAGGPLVTFSDPELEGSGVAGAIGYRFPDGTFAPFWGSNVRFEIGGSYVSADSSGARSALIAPGTPACANHLNGFQNGCGLIVGVNSPVATALTTDYTAWLINGKAASDYRYGNVVLTPSWIVFGGRAENDHHWNQNTTSGAMPYIYNADTFLKWTDWGGKVGLDAAVELFNWLSVGVGGNVGFAVRDAKLGGNDVSLIDGIPAVLTSINTDADTTALVANAEARVIITPWPNVAIKGFVGLNYDDKVPGITFPTAGVPAAIKFEEHTNYYAGGGVIVRFGP